MRLIIVRHGDPNYEIDSLTEKGWREAEFLSVRMEKQLQKEHTYIYTSPLGRAKDTASLTLKKLGMTATEFKWLREFEAPAIDEDTGIYKVCWDLLPTRWTSEPAYYDKEQWMNTPFMKSAKADTESAWVYDGLDSLLKKHGYTRENGYYRAEHSNRDTIVLFCHFGVECVMLGHLLGISPVVLWHGTAAAPSSVTTLLLQASVCSPLEICLIYMQQMSRHPLQHDFVKHMIIRKKDMIDRVLFLTGAAICPRFFIIGFSLLNCVFENGVVQQ